MEVVRRISKKFQSLGGRAAGNDYKKGGTAAKGFAANPDLASQAGKKGGRLSKRGKNLKRRRVNS